MLTRSILQADALSAHGFAAPRLVAHGASASVWTAVDLRLGRRVAIKCIDGGDDATRERTAASRLSDERGIVALYGVLEMEIADGITHALIYEWCPGGSLGAHIAAQGPLATATAVAVIHQVALSVHRMHAHDPGMAHLDIKSDNLLISRFGQVKVADLGSVRVLDEPRPAVGSIRHCAPEQLERGVAQRESDLYSLASLLVELVSGAAPFDHLDQDRVADAKRRLDRPPLPTTMPPLLSTFCSRYLDRDPRNRVPASALAFADELRVTAMQLGVDGANPCLEPTEDLVASTSPQADRTCELDGPRGAAPIRVIEGVSSTDPVTSTPIPTAPFVDGAAVSGPPPARRAGRRTGSVRPRRRSRTAASMLAALLVASIAGRLHDTAPRWKSSIRLDVRDRSGAPFLRSVDSSGDRWTLAVDPAGDAAWVLYLAAVDAEPHTQNAAGVVTARALDHRGTLTADPAPTRGRATRTIEWPGPAGWACAVAVTSSGLRSTPVCTQRQ